MVVAVAFAPTARADDAPDPATTDEPVSVAAPLPPPMLVPDPPEPPPIEPLRVVGFRVRGHSKLRARTASYLAHVAIGDYVMPGDERELADALMSSELFESAQVELEDVDGGGVVVVCTLVDKLSWIAAPTAYLLPSHWAVGAGFAESDLGGTNRKLLLYAQLGNRTSLFLASYLDPSIHGTKWQTRFDIYSLHEIRRRVRRTRVDGPRRPSGASDRELPRRRRALGWRFSWWLSPTRACAARTSTFATRTDAVNNPLPSTGRRRPGHGDTAARHDRSSLASIAA